MQSCYVLHHPLDHASSSLWVENADSLYIKNIDTFPNALVFSGFYYGRGDQYFHEDKNSKTTFLYLCSQWYFTITDSLELDKPLILKSLDVTINHDSIPIEWVARCKIFDNYSDTAINYQSISSKETLPLFFTGTNLNPGNKYQLIIRAKILQPYMQIKDITVHWRLQIKQKTLHLKCNYRRKWRFEEVLISSFTH